MVTSTSATMGRVAFDSASVDPVRESAGSAASWRSLANRHCFDRSVAITETKGAALMGICKPFKLPGKPNWYIEVNRRRRSTGTADHREAMTIYRELCRKEEMTSVQQKRETIDNFADEYLAWSTGIHAANSVKNYKVAMYKLKRLPLSGVVILPAVSGTRPAAGSPAAIQFSW